MPRHNSVVLISVLLHVGAIVAFVLLSILAPDILPIPRDVLAWNAPRLVQVDIPLPPTPRTPEPLTAPASTVSPNAAPLTPQPDIRPETGYERLRPETFEPGVIDGGTSASATFGATEPPPPPPPVVVKEPVRIHSGIANPRKLVDIAPRYPELARQAGVKGIVILEATVSAQGDVTSVKILRSIPLLDRAAADAVTQWKYTPVLLNGEPVPFITTVTVNFDLAR